ncbi:hypothetical protein ACSQ67_019541 [Phaseolus vulgaris]
MAGPSKTKRIEKREKKTLKVPLKSSGEYNSASSLLDLLLGDLGDELGLDDEGLVLRQNALPQKLEVTELRDVDERRHVVLGGFVLDFLGDEGPELVDVKDGAVELVPELVEVPHSDLPEVAWMVLVEEDTVVVHASGVTSPSGMLSVLPYAPVTGAHVTPLLPVLLEPRRHLLFSSHTQPPSSCFEPLQHRKNKIRVFGFISQAFSASFTVLTLTA